MWIYANPNPVRDREPDCVVRALALATGKTWDEVHMELCDLSGVMGTMPSVNWLWGLWLKRKGFKAFLLPETCPECVTVREFCRRYPSGTYVIGTGSHAICIRDGDWMDTEDSGSEVPTYFFEKKGR